MQKLFFLTFSFFFFWIPYIECQASSLKNIMNYSSEELYNKGNEYMEKEKIDSALVYYIVSSGKYAPLLSEKDKHSSIQAYIKTGDIYYNQGSYHNALEAYFKAFSISENENIHNYLPELYKNMGNIYNKFKDYERGKTYYVKGLEAARDINDKEMEWKILTNLTGICCYSFLGEEDIPEARLYYELAKQLTLPDEPLQEYYNLLNMGYIYARELELDSAAVYFKKSLDYALNAKLDSRYISSSSTELAILYEGRENYTEALKYHLFSNKVNEQSGQIEMIMYSLENLSIIYDKIGNHDKALQYRNKYLNVSDSIFNIREFNRVKNSQLVYEMDKVNEQIDFLNAEKEESELKVRMQRRILLVVSIGLCLLAVLLIIVYVQKRKLKGAYIDLFERNNEILRSDKANRKIRLEYEHKLEKEKEKTLQLKEELKRIGYEKGEEITTKDEGEHLKSYMTEEQKEKLIKDINEVMENSLEFCKSDFTLTTLANLIGSNTKYISQIINEVYNKNFRTFVNEYRVKEASLRLLNTAEYGNYTLKAIAESVGYKSHTTFIATFKKITGINPSTYKKIAEKQYKL